LQRVALHFGACCRTANTTDLFEKIFKSRRISSRIKSFWYKIYRYEAIAISLPLPVCPNIHQRPAMGRPLAADFVAV
jgi:hypothetical protein